MRESAVLSVLEFCANANSGTLLTHNNNGIKNCFCPNSIVVLSDIFPLTDSYSMLLQGMCDASKCKIEGKVLWP